METVTTESGITDQAAIALDKLIFQMQDQGWTYGAPCEQVEKMDRLIVEGNGRAIGMKCKECKGKMQYHPFVRGEREYQVWCLCGECGERREL